MHRSAIALSAVAAMLLAASGTTAAWASRTPDRVAPLSVRAEARQWLDAQRGALQRAHAVTFDGPDVAGARSLPSMDRAPIGMLVSAGDLNRDGHVDVLDLRQDYSSSTLGVTARDGRTGKALWSRTVTIPSDGQQSVLPERVGAKGKPGVLVIDSNLVSGPTTGTETETLSVEALSGPTGKRLWAHSFVGTYGTGPVSTAVPSFGAALHDVRGPAMDLLVSLETTLPAAAGDQTTPVIVSGVDGSRHRPGAAFTSTDGFPSFYAIPDVTGDGLADLLVLDPGSPGVIEAEHGHSGAVFWKRSQAVDVLTGMMAIGSYSHRSISDLAIVQYGIFGPAEITILSGSNGHRLWSRDADDFYLVDKAGKHLKPALGLFTSSATGTSTSSSQALAYKAVSVAGKVVYNKTESVSIAALPGEIDGGSGSAFESVGDVQPDGALDQYLSLDVSSTSATKTVTKNLSGIVNGRTGAFRRTVVGVVAADGSLHAGRGTDLLAEDVMKGSLRLRAWRGASGKRYYSRMVAGQHHLLNAAVSGLRVTGQPCSDIALATIGASATNNSVAMLSARGTVLWSVRFSAAQPTGGTLTHHKKPRRYCT
jgi:hypothetical protein